MRKQNIILLLILLAAGFIIMPSCKKDNGSSAAASDKGALNSLIDSVTTILNTTAEGNKPGQYSAGSKEILDSVLQLAKTVTTNNSYTQQQVDNAKDNLERAVTTFTSHLIQEVSVANLVAFWKFNGNVIDSSGNGHNGALKTGYVGSSAATAVDGGTLPKLVPDRFGRANMAYDFNNAATVEVPYNIALNPQSFTISLWIKKHGTNCNNYMFSLNRYNGYKLQLQCNDFLFLTFHGDNGYHDVDDNPGQIPDETWTYAAVTYTNGEMNFYINDKQVKSAAITGVPLTLDAPVNLAIGNELPKDVYSITDPNSPYAFYGANFFIGSLDDIRFYNTALSPAEILSIYTIEKSL